MCRCVCTKSQQIAVGQQKERGRSKTEACIVWLGVRAAARGSCTKRLRRRRREQWRRAATPSPRPCNGCLCVRKERGARPCQKKGRGLGGVRGRELRWGMWPRAAQGLPIKKRGLVFFLLKLLTSAWGNSSCAPWPCSPSSWRSARSTTCRTCRTRSRTRRCGRSGRRRGRMPPPRPFEAAGKGGDSVSKSTASLPVVASRRVEKCGGHRMA